MRSSLRALTSTLLLAIAGSAAAAQLLRPEYASIGGAVVATTPMAQSEVVRAAVLLKVDAGMHVNANPASEDWLITTEATVDGGAGVTLRKAFYPAALEKEFDFYSGTLRVYEGDVVVGLELEIAADAAPGDRDLQITVRYQACNDEACFAPAEATFRLPVMVARAGTVGRAVASPLLEQAPFPRSPD